MPCAPLVTPRQVVETMELVARTSELARVFGIDFFSVLNRGSQYRVESMLSRLGRTQVRVRVRVRVRVNQNLNPNPNPNLNPNPNPSPNPNQGATMPSPDKERVRQQPALEALPCILEPESRFYTSPVAVLDFRSLYPSVRVLA